MMTLAISTDGENFVIIPNYPDWALDSDFIKIGKEESYEDWRKNNE